MTAPRHCFSTHQCDAVMVRQLDQLFETLIEFRRLHVICIASEGGISPSRVDGIACRMAQTAESRYVNVSQPVFLQRFWQRSLVELRVAQRAWHGAHIHHASRPVCLKQADEFPESACGMADGEHDRRRFGRWDSPMSWFCLKTSRRRRTNDVLCFPK